MRSDPEERTTHSATGGPTGQGSTGTEAQGRPLRGRDALAGAGSVRGGPSVNPEAGLAT